MRSVGLEQHGEAGRFSEDQPCDVLSPLSVGMGPS